MHVEVTDQAILLTDFNDSDRQQLQLMLRATAGKSLIIPRVPVPGSELADRHVLDVLISCMRTSAQDTLAALRRRGFRIVRAEER